MTILCYKKSEVTGGVQWKGNCSSGIPVVHSMRGIASGVNWRPEMCDIFPIGDASGINRRAELCEVFPIGGAR